MYAGPTLESIFVGAVYKLESDAKKMSKSFLLLHKFGIGWKFAEFIDVLLTHGKF